MEPTPERCARLRAHKALPRRSTLSEVAKERDWAERMNRRVIKPRNKDKEIDSWISAASPTNSSNPNRHLPPTPPAVANDDKTVPLLESATQERYKTTSRQSVGSAARHLQQDTPPTPESTPPKKYQTKPYDLSLGSLRNPSSISQADSFRTAQEYAGSDAGTARKSNSDSSFVLEKTNRSRHAGQTPTPPHPPKVLGLGLGMDLYQQNSSSTIRNLQASEDHNDTKAAPELFGLEVADDPFAIPEPHSVKYMPRDLLGSETTSTHEATPRQPIVSDSFQVSLDRAFTLNNLIQKSKHGETDNAIVQDEEPGPAANTVSKMSSPELLPFDDRRVSEISADSAVVEAVVLSTPKRRARKLRHSSKNISLRDASSEVSSSNRSSLASNEAKSRLHGRQPAIASCRNRTSLHSDSGVSMGLETSSKDHETFWPTTPNRISSLKSSSRDRRSNRQISLDRKQSVKARPTTAPTGSAAKAEMPATRLRSASDVGFSGSPEDRGRESQRSRFSIPARRSSLSAPTGRKNSLATPLELDAKPKSHEAVQRGSATEGLPSKAKEVPEISIQHDEDSLEEQHMLQLRPSLTRTPFSAISAASFQSSTPGPIELSEATAISIYPHNNKSLLVVQHSTRKGCYETQTSAHLTNNVTVELRTPSESDLQLPLEGATISATARPVDSPARPAVMLIPPTPANEQSLDDQEAAVPRRRSRRSAPGAFQSIRRAFSARRYSDTDVRTVSPSSPKRLKNPVQDRVRTDGTNRALSPFWRPRSFWDDLSDSDEEAEQHGGYVRNTLGLPQKPIIAGPVALARRIGSLKRRKEMSSADNHNPGTRRASLPTLRLRSRDSADSSSSSLFSKVRGSINNGNTFSQLYGNLSKWKAERAEAKQEKQRVRLKRTIGPAIPHTNAYLYD